MPQKTRTPKTVLLAPRVTPRIRDIVVQMAAHEGLNGSGWLRNLIIMELKNSEALPNVLRVPTFELEMNEDNE